MPAFGRGTVQRKMGSTAGKISRRGVDVPEPSDYSQTNAADGPAMAQVEYASLLGSAARRTPREPLFYMFQQKCITFLRRCGLAHGGDTMRPDQSQTRSASTVVIMSLIVSGGCTALGDGAARVKGSILDEHGKPHDECRLDLMTPDGADAISYSKGVKSPFVETFVIAPGPHPYRLRITCAASDQDYTSGQVILGDLETTYRTPFDLGTVVLRRR
jgi:hypothetical protein